MSNYEGLNGAQLRAELKLRGLHHTSVLKTLRERLMADDAAKEQAAKEQAAKEAEKQALADDGEELEEVEDDEDDEDDSAAESANTSEGEGKLNNSDDEDEIAAAVAVEVKKEVKETAPPAGTPISRKRTSEGKQEISSKRQKSAREDSNAFASQMVAMAAQRAGGQSTPSKAMMKKRNNLSSLHITTPASVGGTEKKPADDDDDNDSYCDEHDLAITELGLDNTFTFAEVKNAVRGKGLPTPQYRDFMLRIDRARLASEEVKTPASEESSKSLRAALAKGTASMVAAKLKDICKQLTTKIKPEGWQAIDKAYLFTSSGVTSITNVLKTLHTYSEQTSFSGAQFDDVLLCLTTIRKAFAAGAAHYKSCKPEAAQNCQQSYSAVDKWYNEIEAMPPKPAKTPAKAAVTTATTPTTDPAASNVETDASDDDSDDADDKANIARLEVQLALAKVKAKAKAKAKAKKSKKASKVEKEELVVPPQEAGEKKAKKPKNKKAKKSKNGGAALDN
ncbi:Putative SAP domain superfamily protein [Septoria linicola]|uniref:SAP domain superfamily protein n=1 Tax=Septoria linicola TaxID=215465 RepID=A0A9Q9AZ12_9PEZI|nr:Putative SAP domain superfamily protein [Septoria linicola]